MTATVSDGSLSSSQTFTWTVANTNRPPVLTNPGPQATYDASGYAQAVLVDAPVAYWRLGETTGTTVADSAGISPGARFGGVTLGQPGALDDGNAAMRFDGIDGTSVLIPNSPALVAINGSSAITMEAWINPQTLTLPSHFRIFYSFTADPSSYLGIYDGDGSPRLCVALTINGVQRFLAMGPALSVGGWYHTAATYDGATLTLYVDGNLVGQVAGLTGSIAIGTGGVTLGGYPTAGSHFNFDGLVDEAAIYNYALTAAQVARHYARQTSIYTAVALQLRATDPDGDTVTYGAIGLPAALTVNAATGLISGTLNQASAGTYTVTVGASDGNLSASQTFIWTITHVNRAPTLISPGNQTVAEGASISLQVVAHDPDGDALTYSATGLPASVTLDPATGLISGTLSFAIAGSYPVTVTVSDGHLSYEPVRDVDGDPHESRAHPLEPRRPGEQRQSDVRQSGVRPGRAVRRCRSPTGVSATSHSGRRPTAPGRIPPPGSAGSRSASRARSLQAIGRCGSTVRLATSGSPSAPALQLAGDLTIEMWINVSLATRQTLISKGYLSEFELTLEKSGRLNLYQGRRHVVRRRAVGCSVP